MSSLNNRLLSDETILMLVQCTYLPSHRNGNALIKFLFAKELHINQLVQRGIVWILVMVQAWSYRISSVTSVSSYLFVYCVMSVDASDIVMVVNL